MSILRASDSLATQCTTYINYYLFIYYVNKASRQTRDYKRRIGPYTVKNKLVKNKKTHNIMVM